MSTAVNAQLFHRLMTLSCETPRHLGQGIDARYVMALLPVTSGGRHYGYLMQVCEACMDVFSTDVTGLPARVTAMAGPVFEVVS